MQPVRAPPRPILGADQLSATPGRLNSRPRSCPCSWSSRMASRPCWRRRRTSPKGASG